MLIQNMGDCIARKIIMTISAGKDHNLEYADEFRPLSMKVLEYRCAR